MTFSSTLPHASCPELPDSVSPMQEARLAKLLPSPYLLWGRAGLGGELEDKAIIILGCEKNGIVDSYIIANPSIQL